MLATAVSACASASLARAHSVELRVSQLAAPQARGELASAIHGLDLTPLPAGLGFRIAAASRRARAADLARVGLGFRLERAPRPVRRTPAPEPTSLALFLAGAAGVARGIARRR
jgi:hypothetical protein